LRRDHPTTHAELVSLGETRRVWIFLPVVRRHLNFWSGYPAVPTRKRLN
jgi:hypothetical protein